MPDSKYKEMSPSTVERLALARLFIRKQYSKIDPELPKLLEVLEDVGASECWHKHGTFSEHLYNVYRILKMWNVSDAVARCGLFHSSYSNSYVNLAIFEPNVGRERVRELIGEEAEELVQWFCIVPRQELIYDLLMSKWSDADLLRALPGGKSTQEVYNSVGKSAHDLQLRSDLETINLHILIPPEGIVVKHIRTGEDLLVPRRLIAIFLILTIADFAEQWYSWQDEMFGNSNGTLEFSQDESTALWPGDGKPGLWVSSISRMGLILNVILRDEDRLEAEGKNQGTSGVEERPFSSIELSVPPILNNCTVLISPSDQVTAFNLYCETVSAKDRTNGQIIQGSSKASLTKALQYNPYLAEPHIVLAQVLLIEGNWEKAAEEAAEGLKLLLDWGIQWDKTVSWEAWIAWARVLHMNARERTWPTTGFGMITLGQV